MPESLPARFDHEYKLLCQLLPLPEVKKTIEKATQLAKLIIDAVDENPNFATGLCFILTDSQLPSPPTRSCLCPAIMLVIIANQNRHNSRATLAIVTGFLFAMSLQKLQPGPRAQKSAVLKAALEKLKLGVGKDIISITKLLASGSIWQYLPHCRLHYWQWFTLWSVCLTMPSRTRPNWQRKLTKLFHASPQWTHGYLTTLLAFPSFSPPASHFKHNDQKRATVAITDDSVNYIDEHKQLCPVAYEDVQPLSTFTSLDNWQQICDIADNLTTFPHVFPITRPPKSLLKVLSMLNNDQVAIEPLANAIEQEPSFSHFVKQTATEGNRLSLPVVTVKQGIMTHGIERLGDMLVTHAMLNRFTQSEFPVRKQAVDFVNLQMMLAAEIAALGQNLLPQTASLITLVASSAVFTHPLLKTASHWQINNSEQIALSMDKLIPGCQPGAFAKSAMTLAKAWRLSKRHTRLLTQLCAADHSREPLPNEAILRLPLLWSCQCAEGRAVQDTAPRVEQKLMRKLTIAPKDKRVILESVSMHLYCSLSKH